MRRSTPASGFLRLVLVLAILLGLTVFSSAQTTTATTLTVSPAGTSTLGDQLTLTATVTPAATGTVSFLDGTSVIGTVALGGTTAQFQTSILVVGSHSLTASYSGSADGTISASTSSATSQTVNPRTSAISTFGLSPATIQVRGTSAASIVVTDQATGLGTFAAGGTLGTKRSGHTATQLLDGTVLIVGGSTDNTAGGVVGTVEIYHPDTRAFTTITPEPDWAPNTTYILGALIQPTGTSNPGNFVFEATTVNGNDKSGGTEPTTFDQTPGNPTTDGGITWTNAGTQALAAPRWGHTATLLSNGEVLIAGGEDNTAAALNTTEVWNPTTQTFVPGPAALLQPRFQHTATLLSSGLILMAGGDSTGKTAELYDFTNKTSTLTGSLSTARAGHIASLLSNGMVLIAGGAGSSTSTELFNGSAFVLGAATLNSARTGASATTLPDGAILIAGGAVGLNTAVQSIELFDPLADKFDLVSATMGSARRGATTTLIPLDGTVLVVGGIDAVIPTPNTQKTTEIYSPAYDPQGVVLLTSGNSADSVTGCTLVLQGNGSSSCNGTVTPNHVNSSLTHDITAHYSFPDWNAMTAYFVGALTLPSVANANAGGFIFEATSAGTSGSSAPFGSAQTVGATVTDGSVSWINAGLPAHGSASSSPAPLAITQVTVTISGITANNRVYDANTDTTLNNVAGATVGGGLAGDSFSLSGGVGTFSDKNVANGKTVTVSGITLDVTPAASQGDYLLPSPEEQTTANITRAPLTINATGTSKVYDQTNNAASTVNLTDNRLGTDSLTDSFTTATFSDKNVGSGKLISVSGISISGTDAGNYTLGNTTASTTGSITGKPLTVTATGTNKTYDATSTASVMLADNRISGDVFTDSLVSASFNNKNVGTGKTITVLGISISGSDAGNYTANTSASTTANITAATLTVTAAGLNKTYDTTATANVTLADNHIAGDSVTDNFTSATFSDKNVGTAKTVTVNGITLSGTDKDNYTPNPSATTTANITSASLTVTATSTGKVYDGTNTAPVTLADNHLGSDVITDSFTSATFPDKNAAPNRLVTVSGISISGTDAGNYTLSSPTTTTTASITPRPLTLTAAANAKTYDGNNSAATSPAFTVGTLATGDTAVLSETYSDKNAGASKTISPAAAIADGNSGRNYSVTPVTSTGTITPLPITGSVAAQSKVYDATTNATANCTLAGVITGDVVACSPTSATFSDKNVGSGKSVTASGLNLNGTDSGNYTVNGSAATTANITPAALVVSANAVTKTYDGTTATSITLSDNHLGSDVVSDAFTTANFTDKNAGAGKTVNVTGISISGTDAGNYTFNSAAAATATILPAPLTVTADAQSHVFGSGLPNLTASPSGFVAGETLATSGVSGAASCSTGATALSPVGSYPITCTNGNLAATNYAFASFVPGALTVGPATTNSVVVSPQSTTNAATFTFIATVAPQFAGVPGGTVTFMDNGTALASSIPLDANGRASFNTTVNQLAAGQTHTITAVYNKDDPNFAAATTQVGASIAIGAALSTTPGAPIQPQTLQLASSGGAAVTYTGLSCGVLDAFGNTVKNTICTATPVGAFTLPATATLTIATSNGNSTTALSVTPQDAQRVHALESLWLAMPAIVLLPLAIPAETRRKLRQKKAMFLIGMLLVLCVVLVSAGCGGGGFTNANNQQPGTVGTAATPNGSYVVQITAINQQGQSVAVGSIPLTVAAN